MYPPVGYYSLVNFEAFSDGVQPVHCGVGEVAVGYSGGVGTVVIGVSHHQEEVVTNTEALPVRGSGSLQRNGRGTPG